jgi:hypothetical protein
MSEKFNSCCCTLRPYVPYQRTADDDPIAVAVAFTLVFLIIGAPCLSVGLSRMNDNNMNNKEIESNYKTAQLIQRINKINTTQLSIDSDCVDTNMTMNDDIACDYVLQNHIYTNNSCLRRGLCTNNLCKPCSYVCFTKDCWVKAQQIKCIEEMSKNDCVNTYTDRSTYVCTKNPVNSIGICQEICPDFSCQEYDFTCNCICNKYTVKKCKINKSYNISFVSKIFYTVNKIEYLDNNTYYNKTANNMIYYNIKNPKIYVLSLMSLHESISQQTSDLIIVGIVFMFIAVLCLIHCSICLYKTFEIECCKQVEDDLPQNNAINIDNVVLQIIPVINKFNELSCSICYTELKNPELMNEALLCAHVFHTKCIAEWKTKNMSCPVCRAIIPKGIVS